MAGVELKGFNTAQKNIDSMIKRTTNQSLAFKTIKQQGLADVLKHFKDEQSPSGKWKPSQRAIREGGKTLQNSGKLRNTNVAKSDSSKAIIENNTDYASYNNKTRKFMWISQKAKDLMIKTLLRFIVTGK